MIKPVREKVVRNVKENLSLLKQKLVMKKKHIRRRTSQLGLSE